MLKFTDTVALSGTKVRASDGALIADARICRTGVQEYRGSEVGKPDMATVRVYRPGEEVFSKDTIASLAHRPITVEHPPELVTRDNWKKYAVGQTGDEIVGEKVFLRVPLMVSDGAAIKQIDDGKRELSAGYTCELDWTPGRLFNGETYDAVQRNIRINHVAIVDRGRAGSDCRIGDGVSEWGSSPIINPVKETTMNLRKITVDGLTVETTDQGAQVIERLQDAFKKVEEEKEDVKKKAKAEVEAKDGEIKALTKQLDDAKITPEKLTAMVADRLSITTSAKAYLGDTNLSSLSDADIRRAVIAKKFGDADAKGMTDAEVTGAFKVLTRDAGTTNVDPLRAAISDNKPAGGVTMWDTAMVRAGVELKQKGA